MRRKFQSAEDLRAEAAKKALKKRLEEAAAEFAALLADKNGEPDKERGGVDGAQSPGRPEYRVAGGGNWVIRSPKRFS